MKKFLLICFLIFNLTLIVYADTPNAENNVPIKVFKNGNNYYVRMTAQNKKLICNVRYERNGINYFRELRCEKDDNTSYYAKPRTNVKLPVETWRNLDILIFNKYGEYSIWHDNPDPNVKSNKELQLAKTLNPPPPKDGTPCGSPATGGVGIWKNGACHIDNTKGMTQQEKEDYFRAKDFEEEYQNYLRYRGF